MKEAHLEPLRAAWNGAESSRPWRAEGRRIYDPNRRLIGAMDELLDAELVVKAVNIVPLVFVDNAHSEDAAVMAMVDAGAQRLIEAERTVIADAKALIAQRDSLLRNVDALLTGNEAQREVNLRLRKTNAHLRNLVDIARKQLVDAGFKNLADVIDAAARIE